MTVLMICKQKSKILSDYMKTERIEIAKMDLKKVKKTALL